MVERSYRVIHSQAFQPAGSSSGLSLIEEELHEGARALPQFRSTGICFDGRQKQELGGCKMWGFPKISGTQYLIGGSLFEGNPTCWGIYIGGPPIVVRPTCMKTAKGA